MDINKKLLVLFFISPLFFNLNLYSDATEKIRGEITINFKTTFSVEKSHPDITIGSIVLFPLQEHLYSFLDKSGTEVTSLAITDFKLNSPDIDVSIPATLKIEMGFKVNSSDETVIPIISSGYVSPLAFKNGTVTFTKEAGLYTLNAGIASDIQIDKDHWEERQYKKIFLVLKLGFVADPSIVPKVLDVDINISAFLVVQYPVPVEE